MFIAIPAALVLAGSIALGPTGVPLGTIATAGAPPTLGTVFEPNTRGYGEVQPSVIDNNGDPTGLVTGITWADWGSGQATGTGTSTYVPPGRATAQGFETHATVVAFHLGRCVGHAAYQAVEWYFPQYGDTFDPGSYRDTCTGQFVGTR